MIITKGRGNMYKRFLVYIGVGLVYMAMVISGCSSGSSSSTNPGYANICNSFAGGTRLLSISPTTGSQFGDQKVTAVINNFNAGITTTAYLGNMVRDFTVTSQSGNDVTISFTTAGTPTAGTYPLVISNGNGVCEYYENVYTYTPPLNKVFNTFVAIGASYTAGFQSDSYNGVAQLNGPATWVARMAGAYFPLPLFKMPGIPPAPGFDILDTTGNISLNSSDLVSIIENALINPKTQQFNIPGVFVNPYVPTYNIAIPGAVIQDVVLGPNSQSGRVLGVIVLSNILFEPLVNNLFETVDIQPETVMAQELHPTIIMSTDLYGNDIIDDNTTLTQFTQFITQAVQAFASTGAQVFLGNVPHISIFPSKQQGVINQLAQCQLTLNDVPLQQLDNASCYGSNCTDNCSTFSSNFTSNTKDAGCIKAACESMAGTNNRLESFNSEFAKVVSQYPNVHIVPFDALMRGDISLAGQRISFDTYGFPIYKINGQTITLNHLGGFFSLDDLHPTNTGYAIIASIFVQTINNILGTNVPLPPLDSILASDPLSPTALSGYCSQTSNKEKLYCQCVNGSGDPMSVTTFTCETQYNIYK